MSCPRFRNTGLGISGSAPVAILLFLLVLAGVFWFSKTKQRIDRPEEDRPSKLREVLAPPTKQQKVNASGVEFSVTGEPFDKQAERYYGARP